MWQELELTFREADRIIRDNLAGAARNFVAIGFYLKQIRDQELYREGGYGSLWEYGEERYGIGKSTASRWMSINDRFSKGGNSPVLEEQYREYSKSQLQEMLYLTDAQISQVEPGDTVREIRRIRLPEPVAASQQEQLPGQMTLEDFPEYLPERRMVESQPEGMALTERDAGNCVVHVSELFEAMPAEREECREASGEYGNPLKTGEPAEPESQDTMAQQQPGAVRTQQPELPVLKNSEQRKVWLNDYQAWGLWYEDEHIGVRYYKYDFENGARLIVEEYPAYGERDFTTHYFHLVGGPEPDKHPRYGFGKWG